MTIIKLYYNIISDYNASDHEDMDTDTFNLPDNQPDPDVPEEKVLTDAIKQNNVPPKSSTVLLIVPSTIPATHSHIRFREAPANASLDITDQNNVLKPPIILPIILAK